MNSIKSGGGKCRQNMKVVAESAVKIPKWWQKVPPKWQSDGKKAPPLKSDEKRVVTESAVKT